ncbi:hypothetical protein [Corallococcus sp. CA054B]|uniref:hypothetical protein n=1 Tax=Corallococcus sp. CA054B TaxID=2316734 RepID=UPI001F32F27A|nr:hypothetical protein [Corallococcus sp. CA054B]
MQTSPSSPSMPGWHDVLMHHLEPLLGDFTAKMAIHTAALRVLKRPPEQVSLQDVPLVLEGLKPMLNVFIGAARTTNTLTELSKAMEKLR